MLKPEMPAVLLEKRLARIDRAYYNLVTNTRLYKQHSELAVLATIQRYRDRYIKARYHAALLWSRRYAITVRKP